MEGPSPVSALIHAATMVTAGIFLFIRCSPLLEFSEPTLLAATILGALTSFFGASTGLSQYDIKRIIAYSTCSQLGYMMFACGTSNYDFAIYHLFNHAFFKALLFLTAGAVIHAMDGEQDIRRMGGLIYLLPLSYICILIGSLSLMGIPCFSGYYSKDGLIEASYFNSVSYGEFALYLGSLSAFFTSFYSFRLIILVFIIPPQGPRALYTSATCRDAPTFMAIPLVILAIASCVSGYLTYKVFVGPTPFWQNVILVLPHHYNNEMEFIPIRYMLFPLLMSSMGILCAFIVYYCFSSYFNRVRINKFKHIFWFLNFKWFFDPIYNYFIGKYTLITGHTLFENLDRGFFEWVGPMGLARIVKFAVSCTRIAQSGYLISYIFGLFFGFVLIIVSPSIPFLTDDDLVVVFAMILIHPLLMSDDDEE